MTFNPETFRELAVYDAGLLNDYGGGDVGWWQDYLRAELGRAYDFYASQIAGLVEENARLRGALENAANAIDEMFRYFDGGETRGSYDGKPERAQLRKAGYAVRAALTGRQG